MAESSPGKKFSNNEDEDVKVCRSPDKKATVVQSALPVKQPPPRYVKRSAFYSDSTKASTKVVKPGSMFTKPNPSFSAPAPTTLQPDKFQRHLATRDRMKSLVDLVMWRDVSRSTFVFGSGIFMIISSSYTQDINISFVSVTSYFGLAYLALIFIFRSVLHKGVVHVHNDIVAGEEEAIWVVKLVLPYVNEFFLTLRALFSGDPATTMKVWCTQLIHVILIYEVLTNLHNCSCGSAIYYRQMWKFRNHLEDGQIRLMLYYKVVFMMAVAFRYYQQIMAEHEEDDVNDAQKEQRGRVEDTSDESFKDKKVT